MGSARALWRLLRPKQWAKNLLVFAAWLFAARFDDPVALGATALAFASLCLMSSGVYAVNDARDVEADRRHPVKRNRPVAAGLVSVPVAMGLGGVLIALGLTVSALVSVALFQASLVFLGIQVLYNAGVKRVAVADVMLIALAFVQRAAMGAIAIDARISAWLLFCTGALALLLGFGKRRHEFHLEEAADGRTRASLTGYTGQTLDLLVGFSAALAGISYGLYAIESETARAHPALFLTTPVVLYGVMRYLVLVFARQEGGEPENLVLGDRHLVAALVIFVALALAAMRGLEMGFLTR